MHYRFLLDTNRDYLFSGAGNDITTYVKKFALSFGLTAPFDVIGASAYMDLTLNNASGDFLIEKPTARYYGRIRRGTLVRAQASLNGSTWVNLGTLKITQISPVFADNGVHEVTLKCSDIMADFLNRDFVPPLQTDVRIDEILGKLHATAVAIWPYESYYQFIGHTSIGDGRSPFDGSVYTDFETAETTLPFYGDNLDRGQGVKVSQYVKDAVQAEIFGVYWFSPRDEIFHSISRYHASDTAVSWYVTSTIMQAPRFTYGRDLVNDFSLDYYPRAIGAAESVLYSSDNVPFQIPAQGRKKLTLKYRDPDNPSAATGALEVVDMVKGVDIIANTREDGSGLDKTNVLDITLIKGAASSELIISNRRRVGEWWDGTVYITTLQLRGTPITAYNKEIAYGYNDDSVFGLGSDQSTGNDRASASENLYAVSDIEFAQDYADFKVTSNAEPQQAIEKLIIRLKDDDTASQTQVLTRTIGDVINVSDSYTGHDMDYMIVGEMHTIEPNTVPATHVVTYTLRPSNRSDLFVWDESTYDSGASFSF